MWGKKRWSERMMMMIGALSIAFLNMVVVDDGKVR
jgi:hypothetical protein